MDEFFDKLNHNIGKCIYYLQVSALKRASYVSERRKQKMNDIPSKHPAHDARVAYMKKKEAEKEASIKAL